MGELLKELLCYLVGDAVGEVIPERARNRFIGVLMTIAGVSFIAFAGFAAYESVREHVAPLGTGMAITAVLLLLSACCFKLASKGFRGARIPAVASRLSRLTRG
jgi:hypothetical protein